MAPTVCCSNQLCVMTVMMRIRESVIHAEVHRVLETEGIWLRERELCSSGREIRDVRVEKDLFRARKAEDCGL